MGSGSASGTTAALQPAKKMPIARSIAKSSTADMQRLAVRCFVVFIGRSPLVEGIVFRDLQTVPFEVWHGALNVNRVFSIKCSFLRIFPLNAQKEPACDSFL